MKFITNLKNNLARTALTLLLAVLTTTAWAQTTIDLSTLTADYTAQDGDILTGTTNYGIIIPDGATITLYNAKILRSGQFENPVKCNGSATIIIADDSNNEIKNTHDSYQSVPGIAIGPSGSTFTLNGNTGELTVQGGKYAAGIGTKDANAGNIVINGGHLVVKSGTDGTGIGPDCSSISYSAGMGNITINGGTMTITGGSAGIGATDDYTSCGTITINDGYVNVVATYTGIGGKCTAIEIKDGTVYATGRNLCPGIGGHQCGPITISGGTVSAIANTNYAAGIGSGDGQTCGDIIITGGTVTATGGNTNAPGIGKGDNGGCGKIIIGKDITSVTAITQSSNPPINPEPNLFVASNITDVTDGNTRIFTPDPTAPEPEELEKDADGYYLIGTVQDWKEFRMQCAFEPIANARMTADIDLGNDQTVIGSFDTPYQGTFDGQGHALTMAYVVTDASSQYIAPFSRLDNATVQNLHVKGTITTAGMRPAGITSYVSGTSYVKNCWSEVDITSSRSGDIDAAGLVARINSWHTLRISDCVFTGSINYTHDNSYVTGGLVAWMQAGANVYMDNCLFAPSYIRLGTDDRNYMLVGAANGTATITNSYYNSIGQDSYFNSNPQGTYATDAQLTDGTIAFKLQKRRENLVWGQRIGIDDEPVLTSDENYRVYRCINGGYTNDPDLAYTGLEQDAEGYYLLGSLLDWQEFAALVQTTPTANAKMTADIDLGNDQTVIGSTTVSTTANSLGDGAHYKGIFDGQGHTLTVAYNATGSNSASPFSSIEGAIIKNLHIDGTMVSSYYCGAGVASATGGNGNVIQNVWVSTTISATNGYSAGFVGCAKNGSISIVDCLFTGSVTSSQSHNGCFVGYIDSGSVTVTNCLSTGSFTYYGCAWQGSHTNCYVKQFPASIPAAMQVTDGQLSDGTTATALQNNRPETIWVQDPVLNQPMLKIFANSLNIDVTGYQNENNRWMFIASPIAGSIAPSEVDGLLGMQIQDNPVLYNYDLYRFNQSGTNGEWENYHQHNETGDPFMLVNGKGYLYAKQNDATLKFYGALYDGNSKDVDLDYDDEATFAGFNLVGNPFAEEATINMDYYKMNAAGDDIEPETSSVAIPALTGVIVEATGTGQHVTFTKSGGSKSGAESEKTGSLQLTLTKGGTMHDKAIVSFNEGFQLGKFIFNENHAKLYITQGNEDYAIAFSNGQNEMPLNFKASKSDEYCINVTPEGVEMAYLHLIDNMTGADVDLLQTLEYTFTAKTTDYESRFRLVFSVSGDANDDNADAPFAFINNGNIIVNGEGTVQVIDVMGRIIVSGDAKHCVSTTGMVPGVYVIRLIDGERVRTQKIIVR